MLRRQPPYSSYARHYDRLGQDNFGEQSAGHILRLLNQFGISPETVLDLACGTGAATLEFARRGLCVTGLDLSAEMLTEARRNAAAMNLDICWIESDMTSFQVDANYDLCTCFYDAANYLPDLEAFADFARCSFGALADGGFLAFDINTRRKLEDHWGENTVIAADDADRYIVYRSWFDESTATSPLIITGFERNENGDWLRFDEEHTETAFAIADLEEQLLNVGFNSVDVFDWGEAAPGEFREGSEDSFRVLFLARKQDRERPAQ